jgi:hypothetical protein
VSPTSKWIAVFLDNPPGYIVLGDDHCAASFVLGEEWDCAACHFEGEVWECAFGDIEARLLDFHVHGVKVVFDGGSDVGLDEECVFTQVFKLTSVILEIKPILILAIELRGCIRFFAQHVTHVGVIDYVGLSDAVVACATRSQRFEETIQEGGLIGYINLACV